MTKTMGSGQYAELLGISVQALHKRMNKKNPGLLPGVLNIQKIHARALLFTVDMQAVKKVGKKVA